MILDTWAQRQSTKYIQFTGITLLTKLHTLESGIDVGQGINVGKFVKKNKRRALNKRRA